LAEHLSLIGGWHAGLSAVSSAGRHVFFTVNLLERRLDALVRHIDILRDAMRETRRQRSFHIDAWIGATSGDKR
jgi:hypothetical protein